MDPEDKFKYYDENSEEITLYYSLNKDQKGQVEEWTDWGLSVYANEFSSIINKKYFEGYETFNKSDTLRDIKLRISKLTGFPIETIVNLGKYTGQEYGPDGRLWTFFNKYYYEENEYIQIRNSIYNSSNVDNRKVFIDIDPSKSNLFNELNKNQIKNDETIEDMKKNISNLKQNQEEQKLKYNNLNYEYFLVSNKVSKLENINSDLKKKQQEEEQIKQQNETNRKKCKSAFEKDKNEIKEKIIKESKKEIIKNILKIIKDFEDDKNKSIKNYILKFTQQFMTYNTQFIEEFSKNSEKIINEYDVNQNKINISHINFIVIGAAGSGKSTFINESLLLPEEKKAREDIGESCTNKSALYTSDKLTMIRMWDTQGLDYKITQQYILSEIKRIVEQGLNNGPDNYINVILYGTRGDRFQEEDGKLIYEIMRLYPADNLPVIITQLQAYIKEDVDKMKKKIREILQRHLETDIVNKIEIKDIISRAKMMNGRKVKPKGINELLRCSFDVMGRAITSATCKKFSEEIEKLCKEYVENKLLYIQNIFAEETEILVQAKKLVNEEEEEDNITIKNKNNYEYKINLSKRNRYNDKDKEKLYFVKNFESILKLKIEEIYKNLNNVKFDSEKPLVSFFLEERLNKIKETLNKICHKNFESIYKAKFNDYFQELQMSQSMRNKEYNTNNTINDANEIKEDFKKELNDFFNNEFFKILLCLIIKLFIQNLKEILDGNYKKNLKKNEKTISKKAENSLRAVTNKLKEKLIKELEKYFPENKKEENKSNNNNNSDNFDFNDLSFPDYSEEN